MTKTHELLERLIAFPTVSADSNLDLIDFVRETLAARGIGSELFPSEDGKKASLLASVGPPVVDGIVLSAHSDVVPVTGQAWTREPFRMSGDDSRFYGRGTTDMKGFVASAVAAMLNAAAAKALARPLHFALSYDEEIGCVGVRPMLEALRERKFAARYAVIGEPTSMRVAIGHKTKLAARATFHGVAGHSASAPDALNALYMATDFVQALRARQAHLASKGRQDHDYDTPYTTLHVGRLNGGIALNIVPDHATADWEIRALAHDSTAVLYREILGDAEAIVDRERDRFPQAGVEMDIFNEYPGLDTAADARVVKTVEALLDHAEKPIKVPFGTEAGLFAETLGIESVVCGPGSMEQGHKPDEFIAKSELARCDAFLARLTDTLA